MSAEFFVPVKATEARRRGYRPLTRACGPSDYWILRNVVADMQRGGIDFVLVREGPAQDVLAVYRRPAAAIGIRRAA